jgi:hypothetical protein
MYILELKKKEMREERVRYLSYSEGSTASLRSRAFYCRKDLKVREIMLKEMALAEGL